jgi:hypothetical protein
LYGPGFCGSAVLAAPNERRLSAAAKTAIPTWLGDKRNKP